MRRHSTLASQSRPRLWRDKKSTYTQDVCKYNHIWEYIQTYMNKRYFLSHPPTPKPFSSTIHVVDVAAVKWSELVITNLSFSPEVSRRTSNTNESLSRTHTQVYICMVQPFTSIATLTTIWMLPLIARSLALLRRTRQWNSKAQAIWKLAAQFFLTSKLNNYQARKLNLLDQRFCHVNSLQISNCEKSRKWNALIIKLWQLKYNDKNLNEIRISL